MKKNNKTKYESPQIIEIATTRSKGAVCTNGSGDGNACCTGPAAAGLCYAGAGQH